MGYPAAALRLSAQDLAQRPDVAQKVLDEWAQTVERRLRQLETAQARTAQAVASVQDSIILLSSTPEGAASIRSVTIADVDLTASGDFDLFTVPAGENFKLLLIKFRATEVSTVTQSPQIELAWDNGSDDPRVIVPQQRLGGDSRAPASLNCWDVLPGGRSAIGAAESDKLVLSKPVLALASSFIVAIDVLGYLTEDQ